MKAEILGKVQLIQKEEEEIQKAQERIKALRRDSMSLVEDANDDEKEAREQELAIKKLTEIQDRSLAQEIKNGSS